MKKIENSFAVTGFIATDAVIRSFNESTVARFPLSIGRQEKRNDEPVRVTALTTIEVWRKNEALESLDVLKKGTMITVEGYFRPDEWTDNDGNTHSRLLMVANKFYVTPDKEENNTAEPAEKEEEKKPARKAKGAGKSKG